MIAITKLTLKEALRKRVLLITLLLTMAFLILYGVGIHFAVSSEMKEGNFNSPMLKLLPYAFLSVALFFGTFITGFFAISSAVGSISLEIESGILYSIVPRPVKRSSIILGKSLGYGIIVAAYSSLFCAALLGVTSIATGVKAPLDIRILALFAFHPLVLLSVTMLGTTGLSTIANAVMTFMLYAFSVMGGTLEQIGYFLGNKSVVNAGILASLIMPADALYRKIVHYLMPGAESGLAAGFLGPFGSMSEPSVWMMVYAVLYVAGFLALAVRSFSKRDIA
ncbi:MAG: ABC transporter permease subunit [Bacillota bacterium]